MTLTVYDHRFVNKLLIQLPELLSLYNSCIVHKDVDVAHFLLGFLCHSSDLFPIGYVAANDKHPCLAKTFLRELILNEALRLLNTLEISAD